MTRPKEIEMATTRTADGTASKTGSSADTSRSAAVGDAVAEAAGTVRGAAGDAVARLPEVAATTRSAIEDANRQMRSGSDEMLSVGSVLSFGFAMGLLIGGASRLLVAVALIPAAAMGLTLMDRVSRRGRPVTRTSQGG
jgi:hypothetical protein